MRRQQQSENGKEIPRMRELGDGRCAAAQTQTMKPMGSIGDTGVRRGRPPGNGQKMAVFPSPQVEHGVHEGRPIVQFEPGDGLGKSKTGTIEGEDVPPAFLPDPVGEEGLPGGPRPAVEIKEWRATWIAALDKTDALARREADLLVRAPLHRWTGRGRQKG
jgi:hypothetical protein